VPIIINIMPISSSNHWDDSKKWSNIGFGEEVTQVVSIEVNFLHLIWSS